MQVRISCRLEASEQPGELQCVLLVGNQLHAVDLVVEPGALACLPASKLVGALRMALHPPATELERTEQHGSLHEPFYVPASLLQERYSALSLMSSNSLGIGTDEMSESTAPLMHHLDPRSRRASVPESRRFNLSEDHLERCVPVLRLVGWCDVASGGRPTGLAASPQLNGGAFPRD